MPSRSSRTTATPKIWLAAGARRPWTDSRFGSRGAATVTVEATVRWSSCSTATARQETMASGWRTRLVAHRQDGVAAMALVARHHAALKASRRVRSRDSRRLGASLPAHSAHAWWARPHAHARRPGPHAHARAGRTLQALLRQRGRVAKVAARRADETAHQIRGVG